MEYLTTAECVCRLFGIKLSHHTKLKNQLNSLTRNKLIKSEKEDSNLTPGSRGKVRIPISELPTVHNAVLLMGIFGDPKNTKRIFEDHVYRAEMANWVEALLFERQSIVGIDLYSEVVHQFIIHFSDETFNLKEHKLPTPFVALPQLALEGKSDIFQALLTQSAMQSASDSMMLAYLNNDIDKAYTLSLSVQTDNPALVKYQQLIQRKYQEAVDFEKTLEIFR